MTPDEVHEIITLLRLAADTLSDVREDLSELVIMPSSVASLNGKLKLQIDKGVTVAEVALREAP